MKCYLGGSTHIGSDFDYVSACFANSHKEAKRLLWQFGDVSEVCDGEYFAMRVVRSPKHDSLFGKDGEVGAHVVSDDSLLREMGWMNEGDRRCACCGLATMDVKWPLCEDCDQCAACGHGADCEILEQEKDGGSGSES